MRIVRHTTLRGDTYIYTLVYGQNQVRIIRTYRGWSLCNRFNVEIDPLRYTDIRNAWAEAYRMVRASDLYGYTV